MSDPIDLEDVITGSIEDAVTPADDTSSDTPETVEAAPDASLSDTPTPDPAPEAASPVAQAAEPKEEDEFSKKFGIPSQSSPGRENRIPYSRVKKIVERQAKEVESTYKPQLDQYEAKVKDYEGRLTKVAQFEQVLANDPQRFLEMLATIPAYREIFQAIASQSQAAAQPPVVQTQQPIGPVVDDMPQPDQRLSDGSMVYSMDGLKALNAWNRMQARQETLQEVDKRFGPIEQEYRAHQQVQQLIPKVQAEIDEARRWPHFNENEGDIVRALQHDGRLSLEGAYRRVVLPKLASAQAEFDKKVKEVETATRKKVLAELKAAPTSTSAPTSASRPSPSQSKGNRSLEDIITEQVQTLK